MAGPPFPTAETIITTARMFIADQAPTVGGNLLSDTAIYSLPNFNAAYRTARRRMANAGVEALTNYAWLLNLAATPSTDPSTVVYVNWVNYFDGVNLLTAPILPPDCIMPLRCWQRMSGATSSPIIPLRPSNDGLPGITQTAYFQAWEWRNNQLQFQGAQQSNDIYLLYEKFYADITSFTQTIPIPDSQEAIAYIMAEQIVRSRNGQIGDLFQAKGEQAMRELIRPTIRRKQRGQHRRVPWGRSGTGFGYYGDGPGGPYGY